MKKKHIMILLTSVMMSACILASCSKQPETESEETTADVTMDTQASETTEETEAVHDLDEEMFEACLAQNSFTQALTRHSAVGFTLNNLIDGETVSTDYNYCDNETYLWIGNNQAMLSRNDIYIYRVSDEGDPYFVEFLFDATDSPEIAFSDMQEYGLLRLPETEVLIETSYSDDGIFTAVTEDPAPESVQREAGFLEDFLEDFTLEDGMAIRYVYGFDVETYEMQSMLAYLIDVDGEETLIRDMDIDYDADIIDPFAEGEIFAEYLAQREDPDQTRTITVVYDPDTEDEYIYEYEVVNGASVIILHDGYQAQDIYINRDCSTAFDPETDDGIGDLVLYVPAPVDE